MNAKSGLTFIMAFAPLSSTSAASAQEAQVPHNDCYCDGSISSTGLVENDAQEASLLELIDAVCADQDSFEEGEQPPAKKAIDDLKTIIVDAAALTEAGIPLGDTATYFGEISVTWRRANRMLRLTSFSTPNRSARLDFGTTPDGALGDYQFDAQATGAKLIDRLAWLYAEV